MMPYLAGWKAAVKLGVNFEEQIIAKKKYPSIFSPQMEAIGFIILQIYFAALVVTRIENITGIFLRFCSGILNHMAY